jgi:hypothetical protein
LLVLAPGRPSIFKYAFTAIGTSPFSKVEQPRGILLMAGRTSSLA